MTEKPLIDVDVRETALIATIRRAALDERSSARVESEVSGAASEYPGLPVILDLSRVNFAPSVALSALVRLRNGFKFEGRRLLLAAPARPVRDTIAVTRLDRIIETFGTLDEALRATAATDPL